LATNGILSATVGKVLDSHGIVHRRSSCVHSYSSPPTKNAAGASNVESIFAKFFYSTLRK